MHWYDTFAPKKGIVAASSTRMELLISIPVEVLCADSRRDPALSRGSSLCTLAPLVRMIVDTEYILVFYPIRSQNYSKNSLFATQNHG